MIKRLHTWPGMLFIFGLILGCTTYEGREKLLEQQVHTALEKCQEEHVPSVLEADVDHPIIVNARICVAYAGDSFRPFNPRKPTVGEIDKLVEGEVYFVAIFRDLGSEMQKVNIQADVTKGIIKSHEFIYNDDLYHGSPTDGLSLYIGVFDDDGWPSDRAAKLEKVQEDLGSALEAFPQAAPAVPLIGPIFKFIPSFIDFVDPDDHLISGRRMIHKVKDATGKMKWRLERPRIQNDNGTIILDICCTTLTMEPKDPVVALGERVEFKASGGRAPYTFALIKDTTSTGSSMATIVPDSGEYTAGPMPGTSVVSVVDEAGGVAISAVIVADKTAPIVTAPGDITIQATVAQGVPATDSRIRAFLAAAQAVDNLDTNLTLTHDAPDVFSTGLTTVNFSATDKAGNTGEAKATVTVTKP